MLQQEALDLTVESFNTEDKDKLISEAKAALAPILAKIAVSVLLLLLPKKWRLAIKAAILLLEKL